MAQFRPVDGYLNALPWRCLPSPHDALRYRALRTRAARRSLLETREKPEKRATRGAWRVPS
ncbi:hypothetical protein [Streptomyces sp. NPDC001770]